MLGHPQPDRHRRSVPSDTGAHVQNERTGTYAHIKAKIKERVTHLNLSECAAAGYVDKLFVIRRYLGMT